MLLTEDIIRAREFEQTLARVILFCKSIMDIVKYPDGTETQDDYSVINAAFAAATPLQDLLEAIVIYNNKLYGKDDAL